MQDINFLSNFINKNNSRAVVGIMWEPMCTPLPSFRNCEKKEIKISNIDALEMIDECNKIISYANCINQDTSIALHCSF